MIKILKNSIPEMTKRKAMKKAIAITVIEMNEVFEVETMEGWLRGKSGDFLAIGVRGEMYPIDRDIFFETYDLLD